MEWFLDLVCQRHYVGPELSWKGGLLGPADTVLASDRAAEFDCQFHDLVEREIGTVVCLSVPAIKDDDRVSVAIARVRDHRNLNCIPLSYFGDSRQQLGQLRNRCAHVLQKNRAASLDRWEGGSAGG